jgi:hypothetical protein
MPRESSFTATSQYSHGDGRKRAPLWYYLIRHVRGIRDMRQRKRVLIPALGLIAAMLSGGQTLYPHQCQLDASLNGDPDTVIAACTAVIQGGGDPVVYGYQGYALYRKGE